MALKYVGRGVVSLNSAGSEGPPTRRSPTSSAGRWREGCTPRRTPASGAGPENIWETLETSGRSASATASLRRCRRLVGHLADLGIPLEVSPTSNVATGAFASLEDHPFPPLRAAGVVVTLNSDDPAMFGSWVSDEYRVARDVFGYDDADLADIARTGVRASFADDDDKGGWCGTSRRGSWTDSSPGGALRLLGDRHRVDVDGLLRRLTGDVALRGRAGP